jgi:hypothetical protein
VVVTQRDFISSSASSVVSIRIGVSCMFFVALSTSLLSGITTLNA